MSKLVKEEKRIIQINNSIIHNGSPQDEKNQNNVSREVITIFGLEPGRSVSFPSGRHSFNHGASWTTALLEQMLLSHGVIASDCNGSGSTSRSFVDRPSSKTADEATVKQRDPEPARSAPLPNEPARPLNI